MRALLVGFIAVTILRPSLAQEAVPDRLSLADAIAFGLRNSPMVKGAQADVRASRAMTSSAQSRLMPQVAVHGFAARSSMLTTLQSPMGAEPTALVMAPEKGFLDANISLMMPIFTGGYLNGLVAAALAREAASRANLNTSQADVALRIRESYLAVLALDEQVKAQRARVEATEAMVQNAKALLDSGKGIEAAVQRSNAELAEAKRDVRMVENERRKMLVELLSEMGGDLGSEPALTDTFEFHIVEGTLQEHLSRALALRSEVVAMRLQLQAARGDVTSAKGSLKPQVYGFAMGDTFDPRDPMGRTGGYSFGISVSIPLFDGGMRRAEVASTGAMLTRVQAELAQLEIQVAKEVRWAWLDLETAAVNYEAAKSALDAAQSAYDVMVVRVESGKSILVEQLDALSALTRARTNLAQAVYDHHRAIARLQRATGVIPGAPSLGVQK